MLAKTYVSKAVKRRLLGKSETTLFMMFNVGAFLFQTGAILANYFRNSQNEFFTAYAAVSGQAEDAIPYILDVSGKKVVPYLETATSIADLLVVAERATRITDAAGGADTFLMRRGGEKISWAAAYQFAMEWSLNGAGIGVLEPAAFRRLYDATHSTVDPNAWKSAHDAGLDIPPVQDVIPFDEQERNDVAYFREYCAEFYPKLVPALVT
jgi:hypothetical protein